MQRRISLLSCLVAGLLSFVAVAHAAPPAGKKIQHINTATTIVRDGILLVYTPAAEDDSIGIQSTAPLAPEDIAPCIAKSVVFFCGMDDRQMATTDYGIGYHVRLDGVTDSYRFTWSNPTLGGGFSDHYYFDPMCSAGWYLDIGGIFAGDEVCWSPGSFSAYQVHPHNAGTWNYKATAGDLTVTDTITVHPGTLRVISGGGQSALPSTFAPRALVVDMQNYRGEEVSFPQNFDSKGAYTFSITGPSRSVGAGFDNPQPVPASDGSGSARVKVGDKTGTYTVSVKSNFATELTSAFSVAAVSRLEPEDNQDKEEGNGKEDECNASVGDPINIGIGNSFQQETDYARTGLSLLEFTRSYNAMGSKSNLMRNYWTTTFDRAVLPPVAAGSPIRVRRPDGRVIPFVLEGGGYRSLRTYFQGSLLANGTGWKYIDEDNSIDTFDAQGRWLTTADPQGRNLTAMYDRAGLLSKVTANTGETLAFAYNAYQQISSATDHTGRVWTYTYNGYSNLTQVQEPDGLYRTYSYESESSPYLLTGISISRTATPNVLQRYVTWQYDAEGRATSNFFSDGYGTILKRFDIAYDSVTGQRVVTDPLGHQSTFKTATVSGRGFVNGVVGPGFSTCGLADSEVLRDLDGNVISRTTFGRVREFGNHDSKGQFGSMVEAAGTASARQTEFLYDPRFISKPTLIRQPSVAAGKFKESQFAYSSSGDVIQQSINGFRPDGSAVSRSLSFEYAGPLAQLSQIDGPRTDVADITRLEYHATTSRLLRVTDPNGIVLRNNISYTATGQIAAEDRPNGLRLTYAYYPGTDQLRSVVESGTGAVRTTTWTYNDRRNIASISLGDGISPDIVTHFEYDPAGDLIKIRSPGVGEIRYTLDKAGNRVKDSYWEPQYSATPKRWIQRTFDAYGRVRNIIHPDNQAMLEFHPDGTLSREVDGRNQTTAYTYDEFKRMVQAVQPGGVVTTYGYDAEGRLAEVVDANQAATHYVHDDLGNRIQLQSPDTGTTAFGHDAAGNLTKSTDALGQVTSYAYDPGDRLLSIDRIGSADDESFAYDNCTNGIGRICSLTNGIGDVVSYGYDALGRIATQSTNAGVVGYQYTADGNVSQITYPSQRRVRYARDNAGQATAVTVVDGSNTYALARSITRLPFGPATGWTFGNGLTESRQFDAQYRPMAFSTSGNPTVSYGAYDGNSNPTQRTVHGDTQSFGYDALGRLESASGAFGSRTYGYDPVGNRISLVADGQSTSYTHQPQSNRLLADTKWSYLRDDNGNEVERRAADGSGWEMTHTESNRLLAISDLQSPSSVGGIYRYNALGQRTAKSTPHGDTRFVYGLSGELLAEALPDGSVTQEYVYLDGAPIALLGPPAAPGTPFSVDQTVDNPATYQNCSAKSAKTAVGGKYLDCPQTNFGFDVTWPWTPPVSGDYEVSVMWAWTASSCQNYRVGSITRCAWSATAGTWAPLGQLHLDAGVPAPSLVSDDNGPYSLKMDAIRYVLVHKDLAERDYRYVHGDALGTPLQVTDSSGITVWQASYDPFGTAAVNADPDGNGVLQVLNLRFPGQYFDAESGLHYNYFRDYDPAAGRYVTSDPIGLLGGVNTYAYVRGNPTSLIDPLGLADMILLPPGSPGYSNAEAIPIRSGIFSVVGHGNPFTVNDGYGTRLNPAQLADRIKADPNYKEGTDVELVACRTGQKDFASELAKALGANVYAPNNYGWVYGDGRVIVAPKNNPHNGWPDLSNPGQMVLFPGGP
ncbi:MAG: RHS domain-containing protein [Lysobacter sp.]|nr:RHS domain-containing protein [Lysobacter sp.]